MNNAVFAGPTRSQFAPLHLPQDLLALAFDQLPQRLFADLKMSRSAEIVGSTKTRRVLRKRPTIHLAHAFANGGFYGIEHLVGWRFAAVLRTVPANS